MSAAPGHPRAGSHRSPPGEGSPVSGGSFSADWLRQREPFDAEARQTAAEDEARKRRRRSRRIWASRSLRRSKSAERERWVGSWVALMVIARPLGLTDEEHGRRQKVSRTN